MVRWFEIVEGRRQDFEKVFRQDGIWEEFLRLSPGYLKSEPYRVSGKRARYQVFDYWRSHEDFERCRSERQQEIEKLSLLLASEGMVLRETVLGSFYEEGPEDSGLVLG
ncbi:MAG TPA: hypothetical protein VJW20_04975 [Candidatus Angelobacter sp.]|nr:hypothetical protein [Candidatus Angelobacter sp.]